MIVSIDKLFAGNCDANGNFTSQPIQPATTLYAALKVVAQTTGPSAQWTILVGGTAKAFSPGPQIDVPIVVQPNQSVVIQIASATPNASVSGVLTGIAGSTFEEIAPAVSLSPNTITLQTLLSQRSIDAFTQAANVVVTNKLYPLPIGTQSVRMQVNGNGQAVTFTNLTITGAATGIVYVFPSVAVGGTGGFDEWFKPEPADVIGGILFSLNTTGSANGVQVELTADLAMNFVVAQLFGPGTTGGSALIVQNNNNPAAWQRRGVDGSTTVTNVQPGNASVTIPAGGAGVTIILNYALFTLDNRSGAAQIQGIRVWDGISGSALSWYSVVQAANNAADRAGPPPGSFIKGSPNTVMTLDFSGGAANLNESIAAAWYLSV